MSGGYSRRLGTIEGLGGLGSGVRLLMSQAGTAAGFASTSRQVTKDPKSLYGANFGLFIRS